MPPALEKIRDEVRQLPIGQRVRLVTELEEDLAADERSAELNHEEAWDIEEQGRVTEIESGEVSLLNQDDLTRRLDEVRAKYSA